MKRAFEGVFKAYGLPKQIHTDNGRPFGSTMSVQRYTRLSYWFIDLGIEPVFSDPGHPEQNGRHERMHRDLKAYCTKPASANMRTQQRKLNRFVKEYNEVRPHAALGLETPSSVHELSERKYPKRIEEYEYETGLEPRMVSRTGAIRWKSYYWVYVSASLKNKYVGVEEMGEGIYRVYYRGIFLGYFDDTILEKRGQVLKLQTTIV